jgi:hypothetical protein
MFSPLIVSSNCEPAFPPIGMVVNRRGAGNPTDCASDTAGTLDHDAQNNAATNIARTAVCAN